MTVRCPAGHEAAEGQAFCGRCGQPVGAADPALASGASNLDPRWRKVGKPLLGLLLAVAVGVAATWLVHGGTPEPSRVASDPQPTLSPEDPEFRFQAVARLCGQSPATLTDLGRRSTVYQEVNAYTWPKPYEQHDSASLLHITHLPAVEGQGWAWQVQCPRHLYRMTDAEWAASLTQTPPEVQAAPGESPTPVAAVPSPTAKATTRSSNYAVGACAPTAQRLTKVDAAKCLEAAWVANDRAGAARYGSPRPVDDLFAFTDLTRADFEFTRCLQEPYYSSLTCEFVDDGADGCSVCVLRFTTESTASRRAQVTGVAGDSGD